MCGIFGAITQTGLTVENIKVIKETLFHRGPDGEGEIKFDMGRTGSLDLVHRRLSIIDLSKAASQPMSYDNGNFWIIYNGEIFNYKELKEELRLEGYQFKTNSDTEVALASYKKWGQNCVRYFNGDWAFCIYDTRKNILFLSRDRLGVKPLYYYYDKERFIFSSEIKVLFKLPFVIKEWNFDIVNLFILLGISDFSSATMYRNIYQLEPATNMVYDLNRRNFTNYKYWIPVFSQGKEKYNLAREKKYAGEIKEILEGAVRLRLRADVPVGTCLSGGIDSSIVTVFINNLIKKKSPEAESVGIVQNTFTAAYRGESIDEEKWARIITGFTNAHGKFIYPQGQDLKKDLNNLLTTHDEIFNSTSVYSQYRIMELASKYVKVVLDGQGSDELFGGYLGYKEYFLSSKNILKNLRRKIFPRLSKGMKKQLLLLIYRKKINFLEDVTAGKINLDFINEALTEKIPRHLNQALFLDETRYNLAQLLKYEDRNSMHFSIEARVPFTDYRLVEYVLNIPACYKIHNGWTKYILRKAVEDLLPQEIVWRKDKVGFSTPEKKWLLSIDEFKNFLRKFQIRDYNGNFFWWRLFNFYMLGENN